MIWTSPVIAPFGGFHAGFQRSGSSFVSGPTGPPSSQPGANLPVLACFGQVRLQVTILPRALFMARCWDVPPLKSTTWMPVKHPRDHLEPTCFTSFAWHILASMKLLQPLRKDPDRPLSSPMKLQQISGKWLACASWENDSGSKEPSRLMIVVYKYSVIL